MTVAGDDDDLGERNERKSSVEWRPASVENVLAPVAPLAASTTAAAAAEPAGLPNEQRAWWHL